MTLVLISHAPPDAETASRLAAALEEAGHRVGAGRPGDPDAGTALRECDVVVLLVSPDALSSETMTGEVTAAYERGVPIVPVLSGVSHLELTTRQPAWHSAIGSATAIEVPPDGLDAVLPRVVEGVRSVAAARRGGATASEAGRRRGRRTALLTGVTALVLAVAGGLAWWLTSNDDEGGGGASGSTSSTSASPPPTAAVVADSATTPVASVAGSLRITRVRLLQKFCAGRGGQDCVLTSGDDRIVVVRVTGWDGQSLPYTEDFAHQMDQAYVQSGTQTAGFTKGKQSFDQNSWEIAYVPVPASAAAEDLLLRWPGNPTMLLHPAGG